MFNWNYSSLLKCHVCVLPLGFGLIVRKNNNKNIKGLYSLEFYPDGFDGVFNYKVYKCEETKTAYKSIKEAKEAGEKFFIELIKNYQPSDFTWYEGHSYSSLKSLLRVKKYMGKYIGTIEGATITYIYKEPKTETLFETVEEAQEGLINFYNENILSLIK